MLSRNHHSRQMFNSEITIIKDSLVLPTGKVNNRSLLFQIPTVLALDEGICIEGKNRVYAGLHVSFTDFD